jgi:hypothetical protein
MAKALITIEDDGEQVNLSCEFFPPIEKDESGDRILTGAQSMALVMMDAAIDASDDDPQPRFTT